LLLWTRRHP